MDDQLALRIQLFREGGQVRPEVADFVAAELAALEADGRIVTEATAGMLTSHLMMALTRLLNGEPIEQFLTDDQVAAELAGHPDAVARARAVSARAERDLGSALPESEVNFLGMHLAVLAQQSPATPAP
ncbi:transcriptional antiterminator [Streptomyces sp. TE33382]